ncbi:hypothetical protein ACIQNG_34035 [Streptomyces sp. NPDC091377]|uniref:hypothetical protein n=1 Tax=Streptomyces sp. NPDC091377 TaxID=3365995 RepID=UPI0037FFE234
MIPQIGRGRCTEFRTVGLYRIGIHTQFGTPYDGITYAQRIAPTRLPTAERQAHYHTDSALMWHKIGRPGRVYAGLRAIEHVAPEELRRPSLRTVTTDLLYTRQSQKLPGIRAFAARHGALRSIRLRPGVEARDCMTCALQLLRAPPLRAPTGQPVRPTLG